VCRSCMWSAGQFYHASLIQSSNSLSQLEKINYISQVRGIWCLRRYERLHVIAAYGKGGFACGGIQPALKFPPAFDKFQRSLGPRRFPVPRGRTARSPTQCKPSNMDYKLNVPYFRDCSPVSYALKSVINCGFYLVPDRMAC